MKKLTHNETEIVKSVNELEAGVPAEQICRRLNVSKAHCISGNANMPVWMSPSLNGRGTWREVHQE